MTLPRLLAAAFLISVAGAVRADNVIASTPVIDYNRLAEPNYLSSWLTTFQGVSGPALRVSLNGIWAGIWQHRDTPMNWSNWDHFKMTIQNLGPRTTEFTFKVDGAPLNTDPSKVGAVSFFVPAYSTTTYIIDLNPETPRQHGFSAMPPAINTMHVRLFMLTRSNPTTVYRWSLYQRENVSTELRISDVQLLKHNNNVNGIVDTFGQYVGHAWMGKTTSVAQMATQLADEQIDLANNPGPGELQGSTTLPQLLAPSTKWRTAQASNGRWYLVHPSGRRFWAFGVTGVNFQNPTVVTNRNYLFQNLPPQDDVFGQFYGEYFDNQTFDFTNANLYRKYGLDYYDDFVQHSKTRLKSWGFNTVGAWSIPLEGQSEIPYTIARHTRGFPIRLKPGFNNGGTTFPDPFASTFQSYVNTYLTTDLAPHNGKPNFVGIFVDNELPWGLMHSPQLRYQVAITALNSPMTQPAKAEFVRQLRVKYTHIKRLNRAWGLGYNAWNEVEEESNFSASSLSPQCQADMAEFVHSFATAYFSKIRNGLNTAGLTGLYLGSREVWATPEATSAAMPFIDVYSVTMYRFAHRVDWTFPESTKPVMVSEFSFGAGDRGGFNPGTGVVADQNARAEAMRLYVTSALQSSKVVGVNWFQYYDQPITGRPGNEESYAIGLVSIADQPHREMIQMARQLGMNLYKIRG